jgi:hypothetical protein
MTPDELKVMARNARPRLCWRVGITGHRKLEDAVSLRREVEKVLDAVEAALKQAGAKQADGTQMFAEGDPLIAIVSPLADGADRMLANIAVERGYELRAPLPFDPEEYKKDFSAESAKEFDTLLKRANGGVAEVSDRPTTPEERDRAYWNVGQFVARNCDLLIAIWNGAPAQGLGGTQQIVDLACSDDVGVPTVHIDSTLKNPVRTREPGADWKSYGRAQFIAGIRGRIIPKVRIPHKKEKKEDKPRDCPGEDSKDEPTLHRGEVYFRHERLRETDTKPDYLFYGPYVPDRPGLKWGLAWIFDRFSSWLGKKIKVVGPDKLDPPCGLTDPAALYLFLQHHRADCLALFYSNVHRSAFLLVYLLGAFALIFAVAALSVGHEHVLGIDGIHLFTGFELIVLLCLGALVYADNTLGWRDRWLDYRLLAELLREADLLAQAGRSMPLSKIDELAQDLPGRAWVTVAYAAIVRRAGIVSHKHDQAYLERLRDYAANTRLQDQIAYHLRTEKKVESIAFKLRVVGLAAFITTIFVAAAKFFFPSEVSHLPLGFFAGALPAMAYASFGIRNQAEFEIVSRRSARMIAKLCRNKARIKALDGPALTSDALGREILGAADEMRHDAADWTSIFEVKETEP